MKESGGKMTKIPENLIIDLIKNFESLQLAITEFVKNSPPFPNGEKLASDIGMNLGKLQVSIIKVF